MKVKNSTEVAVTFATSVATLRAALDKVPDGAIVTVRHEPYYDQRDAGGNWLVFKWTEER